LHSFLKKQNIQKVDLIISGLPFKSLPLDIFYYVTKEFLPDFFHKNSLFIQFSYFKNFKKMLDDNFSEIEIKSCFLNLPKAYIFKCKNFIKK
jgi:phospholipid N-methyltransferase